MTGEDSQRPPARVLDALEDAARSESRTLARASRYLLDHPDEALARPIAEIAAASRTSPASIVRLATSLGFSGFRELRAAFREDLAFSRGRATTIAGGDERAASALAADIDPQDSLEAVVKKVAFADSRAVADTADAVSISELERARTLCTRARQVVTFGVGASAFAAMDLEQKLARIGMRATSYVDAHQALPAASLMGDGDVAVGISHSGETLDILDSLAIAQDAGASTIAITNAPSSEIARLADITLLTHAHESELRSGATASRIAQLTVVDFLFVAIAQMRMDEAHEALARTYSAVSARRR